MAESVARPYVVADAEAWNALNNTAPNGHFLFDRRFMEYHNDRFIDASLVIEEGGALQSVLPANRHGDVVYSHQGLTFGGLVTGDTSTPTTMHRLDAMAAGLRRQGAATLVYKALPAIYHRQPAGADLYWLFRRGAVLVRRDISTAIDYRQPGGFSSRRLRGVKKAAKSHVTIGPSDDVAGFWTFLNAVLRARHGVAPVHSSAELTLLIARFPQNIRLFTALQEREILAGVLLFETETVAHAQYIAVGETGRELGALDGLFDHLIRIYSSSKRFFDFGISTEEAGQILNEGLITQKEEFGGGGILYDVYEVDLSRFRG